MTEQQVNAEKRAKVRISPASKTHARACEQSLILMSGFVVRYQADLEKEKIELRGEVFNMTLEKFKIADVLDVRH